MEQVTLREDSLPQYIGKTIRVERGTMVLSGQVVGISDTVVSTNNGGAVRPWLIRNSEGDHHIAPWDGCKVSLSD